MSLTESVLNLAPSCFATAARRFFHRKMHVAFLVWSSISSHFCLIAFSTVGGVARTSVLAGELSLSHARPSADGLPLMWVNRPLEVSQPGQLSLSSFRGG